MEQTSHTFADLFDQLGLPSDEESIRKFCSQHALDCAETLPEAGFWTPQQAQFLRESWHEDSDWVVVIDQLNTSLQKKIH